MKSRLRKLHIDGQEYTWKADVRAAPGTDGRRHRCIRIRVWGDGKTSCALQADVIENFRQGQTEESYPYPVAPTSGYSSTTACAPAGSRRPAAAPSRSPRLPT
jgi:hypothetical protein